MVQTLFLKTARIVRLVRMFFLFGNRFLRALSVAWAVWMVGAGGLVPGGVQLFGAEKPLRLANSFGPRMVLQRAMPVPVWGWAPPQTEVAVFFKNQRKITRSDSDGRWRAVLDPLEPDSTPGTLHVEAAGQRTAAEEVLVGDVWLCAGPGIARNTGALPKPNPEIARARHPQIRILRPDSYTSLVPVADIPTPVAWVPVSPETIAPYALTWQFGRELHAVNGVPVGVVLVNQTGRAAEWHAWRRNPEDKSQGHALKLIREQLPGDIERAQAWLFEMGRRAKADPVDLLVFPSYIPFTFYGAHPVFGESYPITYNRHIRYNACVAPLVPMALRGVLFQCEFEEKSALVPGDLKRVVQSWREAWGRPDLPFVFSEPVLKPGKADGLEAELSAVSMLSGVQRVAKPAAFTEAEGGEYWRALARAASGMPAAGPLPPGPHSPWPEASPAGAGPVPERRRLDVAHVFGDHMVLQSGVPVRVWGWCEPGESVTVSFGRQTAQRRADASGAWEVFLESLEATDKPDALRVATAAENLIFDDVVVGEVWVNSGQSNAGFVMKGTLGFEEEQPRATNSAIRCFQNVKAANVLPLRRNLGEWKVLSPETVGRMSGMGYYFARALYAAKRVPVGIIEANHGGSTIVSWTTESALASSRAFAVLAANQRATREEAQHRLPLLEAAVRDWVEEARRNGALERPMPPFPIDASPVRPFYSPFLQNPPERRGCMFFHTMIQPMVGFGIRGLLWNQGEADGDKAAIYDQLMTSMVADWRALWGHEFPFYFVQMPAKQSADGLLGMWEAQTRALAKIPNSGMIVCNDISEPGTRFEVHPRDKKSVGERLARLALGRTYGFSTMVDSSPMMHSVTRAQNRVTVVFSSVGEGLRTRDGNPPDSWEIAGEDGKHVAAIARISDATVTLTAPGVDHPVSVRLGWKPDSNCNLINSAGLPALPFRFAFQQ